VHPRKSSSEEIWYSFLRLSEFCFEQTAFRLLAEILREFLHHICDGSTGQARDIDCETLACATEQLSPPKTNRVRLKKQKTFHVAYS
jgi:hypothetical protein